MRPARLCHCCGQRAKGDLVVTLVMPGKLVEELPICKACSRDVRQLHSLVERLQAPPS